jgi:hypothetical protein
MYFELYFELVLCCLDKAKEYVIKGELKLEKVALQTQQCQQQWPGYLCHLG